MKYSSILLTLTVIFSYHHTYGSLIKCPTNIFQINVEKSLTQTEKGIEYLKTFLHRIKTEQKKMSLYQAPPNRLEIKATDRYELNTQFRVMNGHPTTVNCTTGTLPTVPAPETTDFQNFRKMLLETGVQYQPTRLRRFSLDISDQSVLKNRHHQVVAHVGNEVLLPNHTYYYYVKEGVFKTFVPNNELLTYVCGYNVATYQLSEEKRTNMMTKLLVTTTGAKALKEWLYDFQRILRDIQYEQRTEYTEFAFGPNLQLQGILDIIHKYGNSDMWHKFQDTNQNDFRTMVHRNIEFRRNHTIPTATRNYGIEVLRKHSLLWGPDVQERTDDLPEQVRQLSAFMHNLQPGCQTHKNITKTFDYIFVTTYSIFGIIVILYGILFCRRDPTRGETKRPTNNDTDIMESDMSNIYNGPYTGNEP